MAGRAAVLQLLPFSTRETAKVTLLGGGYPEAVLRPGNARLWFSFYLQTYLERDVRAVTAVKDLATYLVHRPPKAKSLTQAVSPGVRALAWQDFLEEFHPSKG